MANTSTSCDSSAFEIAVCSQRLLEQSLTAAGLNLSEFPHLSADVNPLGEPRVNLGTITPNTAGRLSRAINHAAQKEVRA